MDGPLAGQTLDWGASSKAIRFEEFFRQSWHVELAGRIVFGQNLP